MDGFVLLSLLIILYVLGMPIVFIINSNRNTKKLLFELKMMTLQMDSIQKKKQESFEYETVTEEEFQPEYENEDVVVVNEPYEPQLAYAYEWVPT